MSWFPLWGRAKRLDELQAKLMEGQHELRVARDRLSDEIRASTQRGYEQGHKAATEQVRREEAQLRDELDRALHTEIQKIESSELFRNPRPDGTMAVWSSYHWPEGKPFGGTSHRLFTTPLGIFGQGFPRPLSGVDTNAVESGRLPHPMHVRGMLVELWGSEADRKAVRQHAFLSYDSYTENWKLQRLCTIGMMGWHAKYKSNSVPPIDLECDVLEWSSWPEGIADIDNETSFSLLVVFDPEMPRLSAPLTIRVVLLGTELPEEKLKAKRDAASKKSWDSLMSAAPDVVVDLERRVAALEQQKGEVA